MCGAAFSPQFTSGYVKPSKFMIPPTYLLQFMIRARIWALLGEPDLEAKGWGCNFLFLCKKLTLKLARWAHFRRTSGPQSGDPKMLAHQVPPKCPRSAPKHIRWQLAPTLGTLRPSTPQKGGTVVQFSQGLRPGPPFPLHRLPKIAPGAAPQTPLRSPHMPARAVRSETPWPESPRLGRQCDPRGRRLRPPPPGNDLRPG